MLKPILLFFLLLFTQSNSLLEVRKNYRQASASKDASDAFSSSLQLIKNSDSKVLVAYKGAASTLNAKYAKKISDKKKFFIEGAELVESALKAEPSNIEIRLIRLSIQENSPKIVNYKMNVAEDKNYIVQHFHLQNTTLREYIYDYVANSKAFSDFEKAQLLKSRK